MVATTAPSFRLNIHEPQDGKPDVQAGDLDVNEVEIIGNVYGEFNQLPPEHANKR
ncbi:hypothetical protein ACWGJT_00170 [Streptomyces xantholiticus]